MLPFLPSVKCPACDVSHTPLAGQLKNGVYAGSCQNCGYFFKFRAVEDTADTVTFTVNGAKYTVGNEFDPATSLNEWLRSQQVSTGTKQMCLEGGCGVCLVSVQLYEPVSGTKQVYTVNSCLVQLYMCDGWEVTTIEGLGNPADGLHPVQQRLVDYNGSQCGFCSPGQVMNMYGFLQRNPKPTKQQVEDNFDATICRCTGYRPILDAMKSFAVDIVPMQHGGPLDIEDLNPKVCKTTNKPCRGRCRPKTKDDANTAPSGSVPLHIVGERAQWLKPTTLQALCALLKQYGGANYRLVFGNTGYGVYKELGPWMYDILIDIRGVQDFYRMETSPSVVVGANLSLTNLREMFERHASDPSTVTYFPDFARHVKQVASNSVRNLACWAGNLMLKHTHPDFVSDVFTLFETVGAQLNIVDGEGKQSSVNLTDFLTTDMKGKVIVSAILPTFSTDDVYIRTFRVAQRLQLSHGYVVAGFNFQLDKNDNFRVKVTPSIVFQGINATTNHATKTEDFLTGKQLGDPVVLQEALTTLDQEMEPSSEPVLASPEYRQNLACSLFYKFVLNTCADKCQKRYQSGGTGLYRPVSSAVQTFDSRKEEWPLNQPMTKLDAAYQVCGEARYVDDLPLEQTELYATFVISTKGNAKLASMDPSAALAMSGVYKFIQASDIPTGGTNSFTAPTGGIKPEEFLCSGQVLYAGQPLAIIVAADPQTAETAASMVKVTYTDGQRPLSDMKEAIKQKSFFPGVLAPRVVGDPDQAIAQSARRITGTIECGLQAHFHLETQNGRCAPDDDGGMHVQCTTQDIGVTAQVVARILNIPQSAVTVEVKRLGGAFGAKNLRNGMATGACALAAHIMRRPIRLCMNFHTNLKSVGKRHPYYAQYEIGFTEEGKLNGVSVTAYANCGSSPNENLMGAVFDNIDNAYHCENWRVTPIAVKTNTACNASCRGPGSLPTHFITESMMDHVAKTLGKDPSDVRKVNLYTKGQVTPGGKRLDYCNIAALVSQLEASSGFQVRKQQVALFNQANRWKKRGISMIPVRYGIGLGSHYNVFVAIYGSDGTIAIDHGGIEMGQGVNTKVAQVCAYELDVPMSLIRVKKSSSTTNANSSGSNSSHTSELTAMVRVLNPELDIGQIEGGFMMGLGYHLTEKVKFDPTTGEVLTDGTWEYTPPMPKNLPINFRVTLLKNAPNPVGVLRSKTAGEPPLMLSSSAVFAIKQAVEAARAEIGQDVFFTLNSPVFAEDIQAACMVKPSQFTFGQ